MTSPLRRLCAAALCTAALSACSPSYPPVAALRGDAAFKSRIAKAFPPGSRAERLRTVLRNEGFTILDDPATGYVSALDVPPNLPCFSTTRIDWREDRRGRITTIQAQRHTCS